MGLRDDLATYSERSSSLIEESPQMDEQNTKRKIIEPLIETLGWEILSMDVELEYSVKMGVGTKKVDYALKVEDTPVVFVEAKGCDTSLDTDHEEQLTSYMRQVGVDWGLLSNGREFRIFRRDHSATRPNEIRLAEFSIDTVAANEQPLKALSRASIESGESHQIAETIESVQRAIEELRENKEMLAEDVTGVVTEVTGESISQPVEDEAKAFIDDLVVKLEEQAHRTASIGEQKPGGPERPSDGRYVISLTEDGEQLHRVACDEQAEAMARIVEYLIEKQGLLDAVSIPYVPGTGRGSSALLNDEPRHTDGREMRQYKLVGDELYLFTSLNAKDKKRYLGELPEQLGLGCEFSGGW